jgi:hypothetical protein
LYIKINSFFWIYSVNDGVLRIRNVSSFKGIELLLLASLTFTWFRNQDRLVKTIFAFACLNVKYRALHQKDWIISQTSSPSHWFCNESLTWLLTFRQPFDFLLVKFQCNNVAMIWLSSEETGCLFRMEVPWHFLYTSIHPCSLRQI